MAFSKETLLLFSLAVLSVSAQNPVTPNAAMLVGGFIPRGPPVPFAELYGCAAGGERPVFVAPLPISGLYMHAAIWLDDYQSLLVCGGTACLNGGDCDEWGQCWAWSPATNEWTKHSDLNNVREYHHMILVQYQGQSVPMVFGGDVKEIEIWNPTTLVWDVSSTIEDILLSPECVLPWDDEIWSLNRNISMWNTANINQKVVKDVMPPVLSQPLKCAGLELNGERGIYTRFGYWYNTVTGEWRKLKEPPFSTFGSYHNSIFTFRGRPTIFGFPRCDTQLECQYLEVYQYIPENDDWVQLQDIATPEWYFSMTEVPGTVCDIYFNEQVITTTDLPGAETTTGSGTTTPTTSGADSVQIYSLGATLMTAMWSLVR